ADVFAAENLHAVGLMTPGSLQAYQSGDKGHLRRMFSMWENPGSHLERIRKNLTPESLTIDGPKLAGFFDTAAGLTGKRSAGLGAQMSADFQAAYRAGTPDGPLIDTLKKHNFSEAETLTVLKDLAGEFSAKAGLKYVPDNLDLYDS
ncbi:hypothetical protein, partial [Klebsiella pneumoniae]|uniref:hypothetical protein n=1 Tax=Klebsiella pneumoniae TaxID=573 RepID=UPI00203091F5